METTTIQISLKIKKKLDKLKLGEKESYDEVLERILKNK
jgi:predicted CopG family antitoxin